MKINKEDVTKVIFPLLFGLLYYVFPAQHVNATLQDTLLFTIGGLLGVGLLFLDESFLAERYQEQGVDTNVLITRSVLFLLAVVPLSVYLVTSSGSSLGVGLLLGIVSGLFVEMLAYKNSVEGFNRRFLSQLRKKLDQQAVTSVVTLFGVYFAFLVVSILFWGQAFSGVATSLPF